MENMDMPASRSGADGMAADPLHSAAPLPAGPGKAGDPAAEREHEAMSENGPEERRLVERGRSLFMRLRRVSAADAYAAMREMAMDRNIRIVDVARKLLALNDRMD